MSAILGKKLGMTQIFREDGELVPVTAIEAGRCPVTGIRKQARDGYEDIPIDGLEEEPTLGQEVTVANFEAGQKVKVSGVSIGKGFQGTVKRHNFGRGPVSHGSHNVRAPGSIGASAYPARVFKGMKLPGQMGNKRITQPGLEIVRIDPQDNLLLVRGSVPGSKNGLVEVRTHG